MALPAIAVGAAKAYQAYQTAKTVKKAYDGASDKLGQAKEKASTALDQSKGAIHAFDGGISARQTGGAKGQEVDMPKLAGAFPEEPGETAPGMKPEEHGLIQGTLTSMLGKGADSMQGQHNEPEAPQQDTPSTPGM